MSVSQSGSRNLGGRDEAEPGKSGEGKATAINGPHYLQVEHVNDYAKYNRDILATVSTLQSIPLHPFD